ncbi:DUF4123 domain-containing protein [Epibacterium sp. MM17-32]|uniref:DUF4123 domain-containing protein n=1 Tax=Epibacterium sp. MM17-32 TaxID=2917734 RepID=UPI001EF5F042|nr:DUF4123 domain-containing protein [Epibacterium sp. MM17-32]MCG7628587.1 DUF4123 domain-containing protein [Epibacterium sp. MM17-32]
MTEDFIARATLLDQGFSTLGLYAVLDGACLPGLPERLEASNAAFECLFQGDAAEDLRDVAPYLVEVAQGGELLRDFVDTQDTPQAMWHKRPGILIATDMEIAPLRKHLRRFLRVTVEARPYLFRFWEAAPARVYFQALQTQERRSRWFLPRDGGRVDAFLLPDPENDGLWVAGPGPSGAADETAAPLRPFNLSEPELLALRSARTRDNLAEMVALLTQTFPEQVAGKEPAGLERQVQRSVGRAWEFGIRQRANAFRIAAWDLHADGAFEDLDPEAKIRAILELPVGEADKMRRLAARVAELDRPSL